MGKYFVLEEHKNSAKFKLARFSQPFKEVGRRNSILFRENMKEFGSIA